MDTVNVSVDTYMPPGGRGGGGKGGGGGGEGSEQLHLENYASLNVMGVFTFSIE